MYSETVRAHFSNPHSAGELKDPDGIGTAGVPGRGNFMVIHLKVNNGVVVETGFLTFGCPPAIACGSLMTQLAKGKSLNEALAITAEQLTEALGGLPLGRRHCAHLAVQALHAAVEDIAGARLAITESGQ